MRQIAAFIVAGSLALAHNAFSAEPLPKVAEFNRDIRPLLSDNCFTCHGPDKNRRKAKLRLDTQSGLFDEIDGKHPVVRGKTEESEIIRRITSKDPEEQMPPSTSQKTLNSQQIALLKRWVQQGAKWEGHWSYLSPQPATPPAVKNKKWPTNPIDHFILAKLESKGLKPSPEADRRTLIRRLNFDLLGFPPSADEVNAFVADKSPDAYNKVVDRLFASPHFGERMAMRWLDLVRYADTVGYHGDQPVNIWPYRDYVIKSFNSNKPFDQFTIEQLAGDLLPQATLEQKVASGYNRLNMMTGEGGAQDKEYRAKYAADRVRTTSAVWLGSTLGCAECHDHKFDPFTTKDFYSFEAFFADLNEKGFYPNANWEPFIPVPNDKQAAELKRLETKVAESQKALNEKDVSAAQLSWEKAILDNLAKEQSAWAIQKPSKLVSQGKAKLEIQPDLSILATGKNPDKDIYTITLHTDLAQVSAIRLETLTHDSFPNKGLSRANGNFVLTGVEVEAMKTNETASKAIKIVKAVADYEQGSQPIAAAIDDKSDTGWAVDGHVTPKNHYAIFSFAEPVLAGAGTTFMIRLKHESIYAQHNIGHFRLSLSAETNAPVSNAGLPENVLAAIKVPGDQRTPEHKAEIVKHYRGIAPELDQERKQLAAAKKESDELLKQIPTTLVSASIEPRPIRILPRGNWMNDSGEIVTPAIPQFLPHPEVKDRRLTRLDLANWMIS
ncbi:MAG: hypothetical protein JWM68_4298, partial [Verrucomicrobiales bacterium]|nr:hypothetical protein [Verrucomicrobiales bacterium]